MTNNDFNVNRSFLAEKAKRKRVINPDECKFDLGDDIYSVKGYAVLA